MAKTKKTINFALLRSEFPPPPIAGNGLLIPIVSWAEINKECNLMQTEFDLFWYDSVNEGVAYFFRWLGEPRAIVLVVWDSDGPTHVECRTKGNTLVVEFEAAPIVAEVTHLFRRAGSWRVMVNH